MTKTFKKPTTRQASKKIARELAILVISPSINSQAGVPFNAEEEVRPLPSLGESGMIVYIPTVTAM